MKRILFSKRLLLGIMTILMSNIITAKTIYYVTQNGTGDGTSWAKAAGNIQSMIDKAISGDEVWVAKGTYYPITETIARDPRSRTFLLKKGVSLIGGFAGTETEISKRTLSDLDKNGKVDSCELVNTTILSGDIDGIHDVWTKTTKTNSSWYWTIAGNTENSYRVVTCSGSNHINGFSVLGGNANISSINNGGGIYAAYLTLIKNCIVTNCYAGSSGGGIYAYTSSGTNFTVTNCTVTNCSACSFGGGIFCDSATNCIVTNCSAGSVDFVNGMFADGGGICTTTFSWTKGTVTNCTVTNCSACRASGGIFCDSATNCIVTNCYASDFAGGISASSAATNCTVNNCSAGQGGGMYAASATNCIVKNCYSIRDGGGIYSASSSGVTNCLVTNCTAGTGGGGILAYYFVKNCIVANCSATSSDGGINAPSVICSAVSNNKTGNNIGSGVSVSSGFISPEISLAYVHSTSFIGAATTDAQKTELLSADWHLKEGSPCINAGTSENVPSAILSGKDLDGNSRVLNGIIDIGAYEYIMPVIKMPLSENFEKVTGWDNSSVFYNSSQINGDQNIKWILTEQKAVFSWKTNLTSAYSSPIFTYQIDGTKASKVFLRYDMYFQAYSGTISPLGTEKLNVEFSKDLNTWNTIGNYSNANGTIANKNYKHDISSLAAGKTFFIRFNANGSNSNRIEKWEIDNVIIDTDGLSTGIKFIEEPSYYCNINEGVLNIWNLKETAKFQLFDINGRLLKDWGATTSNSLQFRLPTHGVYIVRSESNGNVESKKVAW